jgi:lysophospholipase L1-like esterase
MANKLTRAYPEAGWGMPFAYFFDSSVIVDNRAQNGRSTRTFIEENRWKPVVDSLKEGDYVLIQFGHNDEVPTKKSFTTEKDFATNLERFVNETRAKKANPVLITPVARRKFIADGKIEDTHATYSAIVTKVAEEQKVPLIDLNTKSRKFFEQYGPETSKLFFNHLKPGEHPNYPEGKEDDTHFNELGARAMAQIVLSELKALNLKLANRVVKIKN